MIDSWQNEDNNNNSVNIQTKHLSFFSIIQNLEARRWSSVITEVFFSYSPPGSFSFFHRDREMSKQKAEWNKSKSKVLVVKSESLVQQNLRN